MTPEQQRLAEIDARWAMEAHIERQRLIDTAMGQQNLKGWGKVYGLLGVVAIMFGPDYFVDDRALRTMCFFALAALLWAGWALTESRMNTRRVDALVKPMEKNLRTQDARKNP